MVDFLDRSYISIVHMASDLGIRREVLIESNRKACLYIIYLPELNVYKVGISSLLSRRLACLGTKYVVLSVLEGTFIQAIELERKLLKFVAPYKLNTGALRSGNTETYLIC